MRPALFSLLVTSVAAAAPPHAIVLKAARLYDGKSDQLAAPGVLVISGGRIAAVGAHAQPPADAEVIDLGDATLMPGLMDAHTHLTFEFTDDWKSDELAFFKKPIPQQAIESTERARRTLMAGFTTVRDLGANELIDVGLRNAINAGVVPGPRMLVAGNAISARGGHCDDTAGYRPHLLREPDFTDGVADGPDQMRAAVRYNAKHGADVIKVCATGGVLSLTDKVDSPQLTQAELSALVDEAHALGRKAAAHAHGAEGAKRAVKAGIDSIEHGSFLDEEAMELMRQRGTFFVYTPCPCIDARLKHAGAPVNIQRKASAASAAQQATFRRALQKGLQIAFGSDAAVCPHGMQVVQFRQMVELGMKPLQALRTAMSVDARLFDLDGQVGTLEAGKLADVIAVPGDASRDVSGVEHVLFVMKEGVVYKNERK
jgi:imidazolonepropionase-like amidohydrolase